jgi:hypothetical protein
MSPPPLVVASHSGLESGPGPTEDVVSYVTGSSRSSRIAAISGAVRLPWEIVCRAVDVPAHRIEWGRDSLSPDPVKNRS